MSDGITGTGDGESRRIGVYICHCGGNISDYVDVAAVREALAGEPGVQVAETTLFACSDGTQHDMADDIRRQGLDGLVVASCSPKLHQVTFRGVASRAGLNPYTYTQVNIREQDSWVHGDDPQGATDKAVNLVRAGIATSRLSSPLDPLRVETVQAAMVVGAGVAGLRAAAGLAEIGLVVTLVERGPRLGGRLATMGPMFPDDRTGADQIAELVARIAHLPAVTVLTNAELVGRTGSFGKYTAKVRIRGERSEELRSIEVGAFVIATGADTYTPQPGELSYGTDGVVTLAQFQEALDAAPDGRLTRDGRPVRSVVYVYCVGNRQPDGNAYCSSFCCTAAVHTSIRVSRLDPAVKQYHLHRDVRAYGRYELLYTQSRELGSVYLRVPDDTPPVIEPLAGPTPGAATDGRLAVTVVDSLTGSDPITLPVDLVVLVTGMVPRSNDELTGVLKLPVGDDGFYHEIHPKLRPVETVVDGVMIAGTCQGPKPAAAAVASGLAAVTQSAALLKKGYADLDPLVATVAAQACTGCGDCLTTCPYDAIGTHRCEDRLVATVDAATCKGCGGCVPICPSDAIDLLGYTDAQIRAAIDSLAKEPVA
jgi:heterodisulfide reductase subunit A